MMPVPQIANGLLLKASLHLIGSLSVNRLYAAFLTCGAYLFTRKSGLGECVVVHLPLPNHLLLLPSQIVKSTLGFALSIHRKTCGFYSYYTSQDLTTGSVSMHSGV